jgi:ATP-dependent Lon protease
VESFEQYAELNKSISKELIGNVAAISRSISTRRHSGRTFLLQNRGQAETAGDRLTGRTAVSCWLIKMEIEVYRMDQRIKGRVKKQMEKTQKNYYLNEQMRAIKKEMGCGR